LRASTGNPRAAHGAHTREQLLDAAERLFARRGFDATSVREITGAAACNLAAVNYHFGGKRALYREAFRRRLAPSATSASRRSSGRWRRPGPISRSC
jgi:AcrR family transcriptional regulator